MKSRPIRAGQIWGSLICLGFGLAAMAMMLLLPGTGYAEVGAFRFSGSMAEAVQAGLFVVLGVVALLGLGGLITAIPMTLTYFRLRRRHPEMAAVRHVEPMKNPAAGFAPGITDTIPGYVEVWLETSHGPLTVMAVKDNGALKPNMSVKLRYDPSRPDWVLLDYPKAAS